MQVLLTDDDIAGIADDDLRALIRIRADDTREFVDHFSELVRFIVVDSGDDPDDLAEQLGFSIDPGHPEGHRPCDVREHHPGWIEQVYVLSDDGSGVIVFIADPATATVPDPALPPEAPT